MEASEVSEYKKQLAAKLTDQEAKRNRRTGQVNKINKELEFLVSVRVELEKKLEQKDLSEEERDKLKKQHTEVAHRIRELHDHLSTLLEAEGTSPNEKDGKVSGSDFDFNLRDYPTNVDSLFEASALGGYKNQMQNILRDVDRYRKNVLPTNREHVGYTFITRPKLNFQSSSLRQCRELVPLDTWEPNSMAFLIRCLLDTKLSRQYADLCRQSNIFNPLNPFNQVLCNRLTGITGFPDVVIETQTTEGGYYSEDLTFAIGSDGLRKTYDLTLYFKDLQEGPIAAIFEYWCKFMEHVTRGLMIPYVEDIDERRLCYTVSIYRFVVDPTRSRITRYAKATGCFPKSFPIGAMMNANDNELALSAIEKYSVPFVVNHVGYNDYAILVEFNALMRRYCNGISDYKSLPMRPEYNFCGLPYIETSKRGMELVFKDVPYKQVSPPFADERKFANIENPLAAIVSLGKEDAKEWLERQVLNSNMDEDTKKQIWNLYQKFKKVYAS